jgi:hypothetical protein
VERREGASGGLVVGESVVVVVGGWVVFGAESLVSPVVLLEAVLQVVMGQIGGRSKTELPLVDGSESP